MRFSMHFCFAIVLYVLAFLAQAQDQDQSGFISIDCGSSGSYKDLTTGISYLPDEDFTEAGENRDITDFKWLADKQQLTLRSFPEGTRNCYTLRPEQGKGYRYLIRARFMYGNYDNKLQAPTFDLYIGANHWATVKPWNSWYQLNVEIIHIPRADHIYVCLVNTGNGIPFISSLELRLIKNEIYLSEAGTSLNLYGRYDFSAKTDKDMRYRDDIYDRIWTSFKEDTWKPSIDIPLSYEKSLSKGDCQLPFTVMSTAYTGNKTNNYLNSLNFVDLNKTSWYCFYMHFAELEKLEKNQSRQFNIYVNDDWWFGPVNLEYLSTYTIRSGSRCERADSQGKISIWLYNTDGATLPPLINALEVYERMEFSQQETNQTDVDAILNVKSAYRIKKVDWQGDPCAPKAYRWDGLNCSYNDNNPPRIVSLNLSSSGLMGDVAPFIANLTMLQYLDLSNNKLEGTVPEFLGHLSFLRVLNLKGNNLTGKVPDALNERWKNGDLILSIFDTTIPSSNSSEQNKFVIPLAASLGEALFILTALVLVLWRIKRRRQRDTVDSRDDTRNMESIEEDRSFFSKRQQLTYSEIQRITNNFERVLGQGAFGKVYHGFLNGNEVAVKMLSPSSLQGQRQFHAELKLLLRVHHKNLTTLVGYCNEGTNIGLIYEFMAMGNLRSHLSGNNRNILSWDERLRIAIDAAQGLEYLHNGCKPPIVHRDVKSTNILLNEKLQAKLGDFGLSKIFPYEGAGRHTVSTDGNITLGVSASVAGTPGYLDPEYYVSNWLNEKSDVYSFGVVLLEIITAQPVLAKTRENNHIIEWVNSMLAKGDIKNIFDPRFEGGFDTNTAWKAIEIAMACVSTTSTNRPTMTRIAIELKECLAELTQKDSRDAAESKDSVEKMYDNIISEQFGPLAR